MTKKPTAIALLFVALAIGLWSVGAGESSTFEQMVPHYENIRVDLLFDETERVVAGAQQIRHLAQGLETEFSAAAAGISPDDAEKLRELLPSIRKAATRLGEAKTIESARAAFGDLSRAMVAYRRLLPSPEPVVVYCSMAKQVWLQPKGEIGNPYYGQSMAMCGEIVED